MSDVTRILSRIESGDPLAAEELLPLVYAELRRIAACNLNREEPGQTLQATALVHEAWLRLAGDQSARRWNHRGHFFAAAAEAMRRILIERARAKRSVKRGGGRRRLGLDQFEIAAPEPDLDLLALDEVLRRLEADQPQAAAVVKLRYFVGMTIPEIAASLDVSPSTVDRNWAYARAFLHAELRAGENS